MNPGFFPNTITAQQHAKSVLDKLLWQKETSGHWKHDFQQHIQTWWILKTTLSYFAMKKVAAVSKEMNLDIGK